MAFFKAAIDRFTVKRAEEMEGRLEAFLNLLHTTPVDKKKWGKGVALSIEAEKLVKDIYMHLEHRIALGDESLAIAAETIAGQNKENAAKDKEIAAKAVEILDLKRQIEEQMRESAKRFDSLEKLVIQSNEDKRSSQSPVRIEAPIHPTNADGRSNTNEAQAKEVERLQSEIERNRVELLDAVTVAQRWEKEAQAALLRAKESEDEVSTAKSNARQGNEDDKKKLYEMEQRLEETKKLTGSADAARKEEEGKRQKLQQDLATASQMQGALQAKLNAARREEEGKRQKMQQELAAASEVQSELQAKLDAAQARLMRSQDNTRSIFDELQDLKGNLRVMCRIRPQLGANDADLENLATAEGPSSDHLQVISMSQRNARDPADLDDFQMERVFEKTDTNEQIFKEVGQLVGSAINGRNVCIFAYGQTGSGKTHTMNYPWNEKEVPSGVVDKGIIPRSVAMLSEWMAERKESWAFEVTGRYIEIYAEKVYDLLRDDARAPAPVEVKFGQERRNGKTTDYYEADSRIVNLTDAGDFEESIQWMLTRAAQNRRTRATAGNTQSSRSHSVLSLRIVGRRTDGKPGGTDGTLNLIDLAGSERPSTTDRESQQEGIKINQSLTSLKKVLGEMADPRVARASFRESTLTKLLQSSLGEGCRTLMFVMVSPLRRDREETRNTLQFAMQAQKVKLRSLQSGENAGTPKRTLR